MTLTAVLLIVFSVMFHASWNLMTKKSSMTAAFYALLCLTACMLMSHVWFWTPVEYSTLPGKFWLTLWCTVASDCIYGFALVYAYKKMDMSTAYPAMRSLPVILTIILTAVMGWGKPLPWTAFAGTLIAFTGCMCIPLRKLTDFNWKFYLSPQMIAVLLAACGTTGYTVFDSRSQLAMAEVYPHLNKVVLSMSYYAVRGVCLSSALTVIVLMIPDLRRDWLGYWKRHDVKPFLGGFAGAAAYLTVLIAMNFVTNVTYIQLLRLLALPVGVCWGAVFLKEKITALKIVSVMLIIAGIALTIL